MSQRNLSCQIISLLINFEGLHKFLVCFVCPLCGKVWRICQITVSFKDCGGIKVSSKEGGVSSQREETLAGQPSVNKYGWEETNTNTKLVQTRCGGDIYTKMIQLNTLYLFMPFECGPFFYPASRIVYITSLERMKKATHQH